MTPQQLTELDQNYLHMATANQPMTMSMILEIAPGGSTLTLEALQSRVRERVMEFELFRTVVTRGALRTPVVRLATEWDPANNVLAAQVADVEAMHAWVAARMDVALPTNVPRWQVALIEVTEPAVQFIVISVDHCLTDGVAALGFTALVMDADARGVDQSRFLSTPRFPAPRVSLTAARKAIGAFARSWRAGRGAKRWPHVSPHSRRAVGTVCIPTKTIREIGLSTRATSAELAVAAVGVALNRLRDRYAPQATCARVSMSVTFDSHFSHTGNAEGLTLVNLSLETAELAKQIMLSQEQMRDAAKSRPELAIPALSGGQGLLPWPLRRAASRLVFGIVGPDVAVSVIPAFMRTRAILGTEVTRVYPLAPLTVFSVGVVMLAAGSDVTIGITCDDMALPGGGPALAAELAKIFDEQRVSLASKP